MSIKIKNKEKFIIDKTLLEDKGSELNLKKDRAGIENFIISLNKIGIDFFEVDRDTFNYIYNSKKLIYRVKDQKDAAVINDYNFRYIIVDFHKAKDLDNYFINLINRSKIILEVDGKELDEIFRADSYEIFNNFNVACIRINNVERCNLNGWGEIIRRIKNTFCSLVDFCASNKYFMATAISMEALNDGADFITVAFNGERYGISSFEEVILALKVMKEVKVTEKLNLLNDISKLYEKLFRKAISPMKPIIGEDIFKYESGIHVDGIEKNPSTYEPYEPSIIGADRQMFIGKHSGRKAVEIKLRKLNIETMLCNMDKFLSRIREKSIQVHRNISDKEFKEIYYKCIESRDYHGSKIS
ncbi:homocitrate synthase [Clostridium acetobutylicum]|nr:homocitrate synthase [Clostridium acetobutylicum]